MVTACKSDASTTYDAFYGPRRHMFSTFPPICVCTHTCTSMRQLLDYSCHLQLDATVGFHGAINRCVTAAATPGGFPRRV